MATLQMPGSGSFDSQMAMHTVTGNNYVSLAMQFPKNYLTNHANMVQLIMGNTRKEPANKNGTT